MGIVHIQSPAAIVDPASLNYDELNATSKQRLNVGCGEYPMRFYTNLDENESMPADLHYHAPPLQFEEESLLEIYAGHFLEHLDVDEAVFFLEESFRVLKPGGKLGVVVPDTREVLKRWLDGAIDYVLIEGEYWPIADLNAVNAVFLYSTVQDSRHKWAWELHTLYVAMEKTGFRGMQEINRYQDFRLASGAWYQCGLDGWKPGR